MKRLADLQRKIHQRDLERLAESDDPRLDKDLVRLYERSRSVSEDDEESPLKEMQQSAPWRAGALPLNGDVPACYEAWQAARVATVEQRKSEVVFPMLYFYRTDVGLPALIAWLQSQGCTGFKYVIASPTFD